MTRNRPSQTGTIGSTADLAAFFPDGGFLLIQGRVQDRVPNFLDDILGDAVLLYDRDHISQHRAIQSINLVSNRVEHIHWHIPAVRNDARLLLLEMLADRIRLTPLPRSKKWIAFDRRIASEIAVLAVVDSYQTISIDHGANVW